MEKCTICKKLFPEEVIKAMVHIVDKKAYVERVCPFCQTITDHNDSYFYVDDRAKGG